MELDVTPRLLHSPPLNVMVSRVDWFSAPSPASVSRAVSLLASGELQYGRAVGQGRAHRMDGKWSDPYKKLSLMVCLSFFFGVLRKE